MTNIIQAHQTFFQNIKPSVAIHITDADIRTAGFLLPRVSANAPINGPNSATNRFETAIKTDINAKAVQ